MVLPRRVSVFARPFDRESHTAWDSHLAYDVLLTSLRLNV